MGFLGRFFGFLGFFSGFFWVGLLLPTLPGEAELVRVRQEVDAGREEPALQPRHQLQHLSGVPAGAYNRID